MPDARTVASEIAATLDLVALVHGDCPDLVDVEPAHLRHMLRLAARALATLAAEDPGHLTVLLPSPALFEAAAARAERQLRRHVIAERIERLVAEATEQRSAA